MLKKSKKILRKILTKVNIFVNIIFERREKQMAYKTSNIIIKCRPEEKEKVKEKAQKENMTLSEYIRKKIFK
jgi:hypothetical protein